MVGGVLGLTVHATAAAFGLSALLLTSTTAFMILKIVGVGYLLWLGLLTLRSARRSAKAGVETATAQAKAPTRQRAYLRQGLLSNALNPKVALFFVTFLPQFMPADAAVPWAQALLLSAVFAVIYLAWFSFYVAVVDRLARLLRRPRIKAGIERVTGLILVGLALRLASAHQ